MKKANVVERRMLTAEEIMERKFLNGLIEAIALNSRLEGERDDELLFPEVRAIIGHGNGLELDLGNGYRCTVAVQVRKGVK